MIDISRWLQSAKLWYYELLKMGYSKPIAGATGARVNGKKLDDSNASKSKRVMRQQHGPQPELIGMRRIYKNAEKALKASRRYCNNLSHEGKVICS